MVKFLFKNNKNHCGTTVGFVTQIKSVESTNKRFAVYLIRDPNQKIKITNPIMFD